MFFFLLSSIVFLRTRQLLRSICDLNTKKNFFLFVRRKKWNWKNLFFHRKISAGAICGGHNGHFNINEGLFGEKTGFEWKTKRNCFFLFISFAFAWVEKHEKKPQKKTYRSYAIRTIVTATSCVSESRNNNVATKPERETDKKKIERGDKSSSGGHTAQRFRSATAALPDRARVCGDLYVYHAIVCCHASRVALPTTRVLVMNAHTKLLLLFTMSGVYSIYIYFFYLYKH